MDNKSDEQVLIIQATIEANKQEADEKQINIDQKQMKTDEKLTQITETPKVLKAFMVCQTKNQESSPAHKDTSTPLEPTTLVPANRRAPSLEGVDSTKIGGMWTLKHEISSPKFYEILIKTELKGDTSLDIKNFYNHIKMCLNAMTTLQ